MFKIIFKFSLTLIICFIILSFKINNKALFNHISDFSGPIGDDIQKSLAKSANHTLKKSKVLFTNSTPKIEDAIKSKKSSLKKTFQPLETIQMQEAEELDRIIREN